MGSVAASGRFQGPRYTSDFLRTRHHFFVMLQAAALLTPWRIRFAAFRGNPGYVSGHIQKVKPGPEDGGLEDVRKRANRAGRPICGEIASRMGGAGRMAGRAIAACSGHAAVTRGDMLAARA